jgi:hypothetical protein
MLTEIVLYMPNRPGELAKALKVLYEVNINVQAFGIEPAEAYTIVRLIIPQDQLVKAKEEFNKNAYRVEEAKVFAVMMPHKPGELLRLAETFGRESVNIEYGYLTLVPKHETAVVIVGIKEDKRGLAQTLLEANKFEQVERIPE